MTPRAIRLSTEFEQTTYFEWLNSSFASAKPNVPELPYARQFQGHAAGVTKSPTSRTAHSQWYQRLGHLHRCRLTNWFSRHVRLMRVISSPASTSSHSICSISSGPIWGCTRQMGCYPTPCAVPITARKMRLMERSLQAQSSAQVSFDSVMINGSQLQADVRVKNLVGHKLPSGVSFRRAFLDFQVLDAQNNVLWESGGTNANGVITDTLGNPLVTEFFSPVAADLSTTLLDRQSNYQRPTGRDLRGDGARSSGTVDHQFSQSRRQGQGQSHSASGLVFLRSKGRYYPSRGYRG